MRGDDLRAAHGRSVLHGPAERVVVGNLDQRSWTPVGIGDPAFPQPPGHSVFGGSVDVDALRPQALVLGVDVGHLEPQRRR